MFTISTLLQRLPFASKPRRQERRTELRPCPDLLEGRELMAPFAGQFFAQRLQQARLAGAGLGHLRTNAAVVSPMGTVPGRIVRNPALISPVDPFGQFRTHRAVRPTVALPSGGTSTPISNPNLISPVDPYGQFKTQDAVAPTATNPTGGPSTPVSDPSLISPVDPYGQFRLN